jgi:hypothetical protein
MLLDLDVNSDLLALDINDRFTFALARTLSLDTSRADSGTFDQTGAPSLLDQYDYVMYGKVRVCRRTPQRSQPHRARILRAFSAVCLRAERRLPATCAAACPCLARAAVQVEAGQPQGARRFVRLLRRTLDAAERRRRPPLEAAARQPDLPPAAEQAGGELGEGLGPAPPKAWQCRRLRAPGGVLLCVSSRGSARGGVTTRPAPLRARGCRLEIRYTALGE